VNREKRFELNRLYLAGRSIVEGRERGYLHKLLLGFIDPVLLFHYYLNITLILEDYYIYKIIQGIRSKSILF
jgi:hypothetical protein